MPYGLAPNHTSLGTHAAEGDMLVHSQVLGLAVYSSLSLSPHTQGPPAPHELLLENWMQPCPRWADTMAGELDALVVAVSLSPVPHKEAVERSRTICFPFSPFFLTWCAPPNPMTGAFSLGCTGEVGRGRAVLETAAVPGAA